MKRDGRRAGSEQGTAAPATALATRGRPLDEHTAGEPGQARRRCRDPAQADRAKRDGRRAGSEQGTAAPATALAARGRPLDEHTAGEPGRCTWAAYAGRGKPVGDAVIRRWRTARSETAEGPAASKGPPRRPPPSPRAGDLSTSTPQASRGDAPGPRRRAGASPSAVP